MNCAEFQKESSLYADDRLPAYLRDACDVHLRCCPVCRDEMMRERALTRELAQLGRPETPADLAVSIRRATAIEAAAKASRPALSPYLFFYQWLRPHLMPYTVGAFTSVLLFFCMMAAVVPNTRILLELNSNARAAGEGGITTTGVIDGDGPFDVNAPLTPENYASSRINYSAESPSLNPKGALAALAWSRARGGTRPATEDDEMVVVADVFSNGSATLAGVVLAPRNHRMLDDVQKAFRLSPAFVPASLDHRPQTMRVVLAIQRMDVHEQDF